MALTDEVFQRVTRRLRERADSLCEVHRFRNTGIEGWLKVEVVAALGPKVKQLRNKGPDLLLASGDRIELKAATDLIIGSIREGATKYGTPCIFLGDGSKPKQIDKIAGGGVKLLAHEVFSDGANKWVVGMVAPEE